MQKPKPVVFIGASGNMCQMAIQRFAKAINSPLVLADIVIEPVEKLRAMLPPNRATTLKLDLFNRKAVLDAITGAGLVVLGAGPYTRTSEPVIKACLEAKVPYLDFDDDVESTQAALDLHEEARKAGVPFYINCGASPGLTNVMVSDATQELDVVTAIEICWLVGAENSGAGGAVMQHLMHIAAGPCLTWQNGMPKLKESFTDTVYAPMRGHSEMMLHETAHPEPVTLPRRFPKADSIRCYGALSPAPKFGVARGLATAVRHERLSLDEAVDFQLAVRHGGLSLAAVGGFLRELVQALPGIDVSNQKAKAVLEQAEAPPRAAIYAVQGLVEQINSRECTREEVRDFIMSATEVDREETAGGLLVRAIGIRNGHPSVITKRTPTTGIDSHLMKSMATVTGTSCAAFMVLALRAGRNEGGVFPPEDWAEPQAFYQALMDVGTPKDELVETYSH